MGSAVDAGSDGTVFVHVAKDLCASSGACVFDAPSVFEFDEDDEARVVEGATGLGFAALKAIAFNCPAGAITVSATDAGSAS